MRPKPKKEEESAEAKAKEAERVAAATETPGKITDTGSGVDVDESVDVSDDALAQARLAKSEKVAEKEEPATPGSEANEPVEDDDNPNVNGLDETTSAILETLKVEKKEETPKGQTPEQRIKELERKNKDLFDENQKIKTKPEVNPVSPSTPQDQPPPMTKEAYAEWVQEKYSMDMDEFERQMKFTKDYITEFVMPEFNGLKDKIKQTDIKKALGNNKLYQQLKKDVDHILATDPDIKGISDEATRNKMALVLAKDKNMPAVVKALEQKAEKRATERRRVIPSDRNSVKGGQSHANDGIDVELNEATLADMRKLGISKEDLKEYKGKLKLE